MLDREGIGIDTLEAAYVDHRHGIACPVATDAVGVDTAFGAEAMLDREHIEQLHSITPARGSISTS